MQPHEQDDDSNWWQQLDAEAELYQDIGENDYDDFISAVYGTAKDGCRTGKKADIWERQD